MADAEACVELSLHLVNRLINSLLHGNINMTENPLSFIN